MIYNPEVRRKFSYGAAYKLKLNAFWTVVSSIPFSEKWDFIKNIFKKISKLFAVFNVYHLKYENVSN